ncbi:unnamed protein product [Lactuca virosa]|uniref:Uncharacterized protein n=1 Tax=Lactuca virosa TaxID=75947 RepID=A0AAU9NSL0_9ASTR|nr:unnamed protein product [Lactuca virosa]
MFVGPLPEPIYRHHTVVGSIIVPLLHSFLICLSTTSHRRRPPSSASHLPKPLPDFVSKTIRSCFTGSEAEFLRAGNPPNRRCPVVLDSKYVYYQVVNYVLDSHHILIISKYCAFWRSSSDHWDVRDNLFHDDGDDNREEAANYNSSLFLVLFRSIKLFYL